jgi:hypothetical protein
MKNNEGLAGSGRVEAFGLDNEIVQTITVRCDLSMTKAQIIEALGGKGARRIALPELHPLDAFDAGDGPQGDIPEVVGFSDFVWHGGENSWRPRALAAFAALTSGTASFLLVDVDGQYQGYEIEDGKLHRADVGIAFQRRGEDEATVKSIASIVKQLIPTHRRKK